MTDLLFVFISDSVLMLILNSLRIPQFAVEKYVGNLQNGELKYIPATWGSHEIGIIPLIWPIFQTSNLGKCYDHLKKPSTFRIPQFAVGKYVVKLQNGELRLKSCNLGKPRIRLMIEGPVL